MKKNKIFDIVFSCVLVITLAVTMLMTQGYTAFASSVNNQAISIKNTAYNLSKNGNVITTYTNEDDKKEKTIVWANGVNPPTMGSNGDFVREEYSPNNKITYITYTAPFEKGNGYYDINKVYGEKDINLCFAAAASNSLHWWLQQNATYIDRYLEKTGNTPKNEQLKKQLNSFYAQDNSEIYKRFVQQFANRPNGQNADLLVDQFINGYLPKEAGGTNDPDYDGDKLIQNGPCSQGGYFYDVFSKNIVTQRRGYFNSYSIFGNDIKNALLNDSLVLVDYNWGNLNHVVTLWGAEYDANGQISAIYITDSDDEKNVSQGMVRYRVVNDNGDVVLTTNSLNTGSKVCYLNIISSGKKMWEDYFNPKESFNVEYNKNANDATGIMTNQTVVEGVDITLAKNKFTRAGYVFKGWSTSPSGNVVYTDNQVITNINSNLTLYAVWAKKQEEIITPPTIFASDVEIFVGDYFNPLDNVYLIDNKGDRINLTNENIAYNNVLTDTVGVYKVTYRVTDNNGIIVSKSISVKVKENIVTPDIPENPDIPVNPDIPENPVNPDTPIKPDISNEEDNVNNQPNVALISSLSVVGVIAVVGVGLYIFKKRKSK